MDALKRIALTASIFTGIALAVTFSLLRHWEAEASEFTTPAPRRPVDVLLDTAVRDSGFQAMIEAKSFQRMPESEKLRAFEDWSSRTYGDRFKGMSEEDKANFVRRLYKNAEALLADREYRVRMKPFN